MIDRESFMSWSFLKFNLDLIKYKLDKDKIDRIYIFIKLDLDFF